MHCVDFLRVCFQGANGEGNRDNPFRWRQLRCLRRRLFGGGGRKRGGRGGGIVVLFGSVCVVFYKNASYANDLVSVDDSPGSNNNQCLKLKHPLQLPLRNVQDLENAIFNQTT